MKPPMPEFIHGDARAIPLPDASVDLLVTSPPYWSLRSYVDAGQHYDGQIGAEPTWQEYLDNLIDCTREWMRVLKPTGSAWVNLGDKYAGSGGGGEGSSDGATSRGARPPRRSSTVPAKSLMLLPHRYAMRCVDELGLILRQDQVWAKANGLPESVVDRTRHSHEYFFHLTKRSRYYSAVDEIRSPTWTGARGSSASSSRAQDAGHGPQGCTSAATASSGATVAPNWPTEFPTNCSWEPSRAACSSTTCAATACALTPSTSSPSPCARTCTAATPTQPRTGPRRTANTATPTTRPTPTARQTASACVACACEPATAAATGGSADPLGSLPPSVWEIATQPLRVPPELGIDHFAAMPMEWPRRLIQGWSPREVCTACGEGRRPVVAKEKRLRAPGGEKYLGKMMRRPDEPMSVPDILTDCTITGYACDCPDTSAPAEPGVVLDPFSGTGTTALVATMLGRRGVGVELSSDYIRLAEWRASDPKERARAAGLDPDDVAKVRPQLPGQFDLFGEEAS